MAYCTLRPHKINYLFIILESQKNKGQAARFYIYIFWSLLSNEDLVRPQNPPRSSGWPANGLILGIQQLKKN